MATAKASRSGIWKLLLILAAAITLFSVVAWFKANQAPNPPQQERFSNRRRRERFQEDAGPMPDFKRGMDEDELSVATGGVQPMETADNELYLPVSDAKSGATSPGDVFPADRLKPEDLLPKDAANSKWAQLNPAGQGGIQDQNFLTAGYHIGFDTQGGSMRNASHDLRSTPANPRYNVSIWQMSTIEPDMSRRPLE